MIITQTFAEKSTTYWPSKSKAIFVNKRLWDLTKLDFPDVNGGFQLEFVSIIQVINHMTCYKFNALIGRNYSIQTGEQIL